MNRDTVIESLQRTIRAHECLLLGSNAAAVVALGYANTDARAATRIDDLLANYARFPARIVSFLQLARQRVGASSELAATTRHEILVELDRNLGQELGSETEGVSHYQLLKDGLRASLDLAVEQIPPCPATERFLAELQAGCDASAIARVLGSVYAMEASASPELIVVRTIYERRIRLLSDEQRDTASWRDANGQLTDFFARHISEWEPSHENMLMSAIEPLLGDEAFLAPFTTAIHDVLRSMSRWWRDLAAEMAR